MQRCNINDSDTLYRTKPTTLCMRLLLIGILCTCFCYCRIGSTGCFFYIATRVINLLLMNYSETTFLQSVKCLKEIKVGILYHAYPKVSQSICADHHKLASLLLLMFHPLVYLHHLLSMTRLISISVIYALFFHFWFLEVY